MPKHFLTLKEAFPKHGKLATAECYWCPASAVYGHYPHVEKGSARFQLQQLHHPSSHAGVCSVRDLVNSHRLPAVIRQEAEIDAYGLPPGAPA